MSSISSYGFRTTTLDLHNQIRETYVQRGTSRKELGLGSTATLIKDVDKHDCFLVEKDFAQEKARRRIYGHYIRACFAYYMECSTWRGKTELTGQSSSCGGCQGSHWCLTPTLCDDKMQIVMQQIILNGLTPRKIVYLQKSH